jgi:hypothetical protein
MYSVTAGRDLLEQVLLDAVESFAVLGMRRHPVRRALVHDDLARLSGNGRHDLVCARTRADHAGPRPGQVDIAIPLRGVHRRVGELVPPREIWIFRHTQQS